MRLHLLSVLLAVGAIATATPHVRAQGADLCANAQPLGLSSPGTATVQWNATAATDDGDFGCGCPAQPDVWFNVQPTVTGIMTFAGSGASFAMFSACGGQPIACANNTAGGPSVLSEFPVVAGQTYKLAVQPGNSDICDNELTTAFQFDVMLSSSTPPANDTCTTATTAVVGDNAFDNRLATTDSTATCAESTNDVWFSFTAPATNIYRFSRTGLFYVSLTNAVLTVFDSCNGTQLACSSNTSGVLTANADVLLQAGQTVRVRIASRTSANPFSPNAGPGILKVALAPIAPNDTCATATPVLAGTTLIDTRETFDDSIIAPCNPFPATWVDKEVWYTLTPTATGNITLSISRNFSNPAPFLTQATLTVYSACGGSVLGCAALAVSSSDGPWLCNVPVTQGQPIRIRVGSPSTGGVANLNITAPGPRPTNDNCTTAQQVGNGTFNFDITRACGSPAGQLWYRYTNTTTGRRNIRFRTCGSTFATQIAAVPDGSCASTDQSYLTANSGGGCPNDPNGSTIRLCLEAQESILIAISSAGGTGAGTLNVASSLPATNDNCTTATALNVGNNSFNTTLGCGNGVVPCDQWQGQVSFGRDVWYSFTPAANGYVSFTINTANNRAMGMSAFADCNGTLLGCTDTSYREDLCIPAVQGQPILVALSELLEQAVSAAQLDFGTGTLRVTFTAGQYSPPEETIESPEDCVAFNFEPCDFAPVGLEMQVGTAYSDTAASVHLPTPEGDIEDKFYFNMTGPGFVRFVGQTQFPGYINFRDNGFDCEDNDNNSDITLTNYCLNNIDTGQIFFPRAGRHSISIFSDALPTWRQCSDPDINYWIQLVECSSCSVVCDSIDFNQNGVFPEDQDVVDFFNVLAGGDCPTCNDIDFNNNQVFPEDQDVIDFFNVLAGGTC